MYKIFPITPDGDQVMVEFEYQEEMHAFKALMHIISQCIKLGTGQTEFWFNVPGDITTLQKQVLSTRVGLAKKILGRKVATLNIGQDCVIIALYKK